MMGLKEGVLFCIIKRGKVCDFEKKMRSKEKKGLNAHTRGRIQGLSSSTLVEGLALYLAVADMSPKWVV
jgi:hypothetical protein